MAVKTKRRLIETYVVRLKPASEESRPSTIMKKAKQISITQKEY